MKKVLTDVSVRTAQAPAEGSIDIGDKTCRGLVLRITKNNSKTWALRFVDEKTGRQTRHAFGRYPDMGLAAARARADELRAAAKQGANPTTEKRRQRVEAPIKTFGYLAERYVNEHARRHKASAEGDERNLRLHLLPKWKDRPYAEIERADVIELIEGLITSGKETLANRVGALVSKIFSFGIDAGLIKHHPATRLGKRGVERIGDRVLNDAELRMFWPAAVLPPISPTVGLALRLQLLTAMRPSEAAGLRRDELQDFEDPKTAAILLPPARTKNGLKHLVPLTSAACGIIEEALALAPEDSERVFGVEGHSLATAMRRFCEALAGKDAAIKTWRADRPTPHDLRRTARTRLGKLGIPEKICDALLNHAKAGVGRKHYDHNEYVEEKRFALNAWADLLATILDGQGVDSNVVRLRR